MNATGILNQTVFIHRQGQIQTDAACYRSGMQLGMVLTTKPCLADKAKLDGRKG